MKYDIMSILGYYDKIHGICRDVPEIKILPLQIIAHNNQINKHFLVKEILLLISLIGLLVILFPPLINFIKRPRNKQIEGHLYRPSLKVSFFPWSGLEMFLIPNAKGALILVFLTLIAIICGDYIFSNYDLLQNIFPETLVLSNVITVQVAALAILFPLIILILERDSELVLPIKRNEILLRHALGFPVSILLIMFSLYYLFGTSLELSALVAAISIILALIVLYKLLEATFSISIYRRAESSLFHHFVQQTTVDEAINRISYNLSHEQIEKCHPLITNLVSFGLLDRKLKDVSYLDVTSERSGVIDEINLNSIMFAAEKLQNLCTLQDSTVNSQVPNNISVIDKCKIGLAHLGESISESNPLIARIQFPKSISPAKIKPIAKQIREAFIVSTVENHHANTLEEIMIRLENMGRIAIRDNDNILLDNLRKHYKQIYLSFSQALGKFKVKYTFKDAKNEISLFGTEWKSFESIDRHLSHIYRIITLSSSDETRSMVIHFPYHLATDALKYDDPLGFYRFTRFAITQAYIFKTSSEQDRDQIIGWISSLGRYFLLPDIERNFDDNSKIESKLKYLRHLVWVLQNIAKEFISENHIESANAASKALREITQLERYEDYSHQIEHYKFVLSLPDDKVMDKESYRNSLAELEVRQKYIDMTNCWYNESMLGLSNYCLQIIDGVTKTNASHEHAFIFLQQHFHDMSCDIYQLIRFYSMYHSKDFSENWNWEQWEEHEAEKVYHPYTSGYIERLFAVLFCNVALRLPDSIKLDQIDIEFQITYRLKEGAGNLRQLITDCSNKPEWALLPEKPTEDQRNKLFSIFDDLIKEEARRTDIAVSLQKLSEQKIQKEKKEFEKNFTKSVIVRNYFQVKEVPIAGDEFETSWGINTLVNRDFLIDNSKYHPLELGSHYGNDLARSEDEYLFAEIARNAKLSTLAKDIHLEDLVKNTNIELENVLIMSSKSLDMTTIFHQQKSYIPKYKLKEKDQEKLKFSGLLKIGHFDIPVIEVFIQNDQTDNLLLILDRTKIKIEFQTLNSPNYLVKSHFLFKITDPNQNSKLKKQIIDQQPDWLKDYSQSDQEKIVGKYVWLKVVENISVSLDISTVFAYNISDVK